MVTPLRIRAFSDFLEWPPTKNSSNKLHYSQNPPFIEETIIHGNGFDNLAAVISVWSDNSLVGTIMITYNNVYTTFHLAQTNPCTIFSSNFIARWSHN